MTRSQPPPNRVGHTIGGRYEVLSLLGEGGQSAVYRARDRRAGDEVALKVLKPGTSPEATERMFREARAMASLQGTAAVRVLDQQWADDGAMCLVTELLEGAPLDEALLAFESKGERAPIPWILGLMGPVVTTLQAAHGMGIVHRDLKPANIFVISEARGGGVRLLDFGFAKFVRLRGLTAAGMVAGSPSYIAPETWQGRHEAIDHRIDVYALGGVIFRCVGGQAPFTAKDLTQLLREVTAAPRPSLRALRPELGPDIDDWVTHALSIDPGERFQSVTALFRAFRHVVESH